MYTVIYISAGNAWKPEIHLVSDLNLFQTNLIQIPYFWIITSLFSKYFDFFFCNITTLFSKPS